MKKILPIALGVVALGLLVTPKIIGTQVDDRLNAAATSINDIPGYQLNILQKEDAWFSSSAQLELVIDGSALGQGQLAGDTWRIPFDLSAVHGPILFGNNIETGFVTWQLSAAADGLREHLSWPADTAFYQMNAKIDLASQLDYQDQITPFSLIDIEEGGGEFSGYKGKAEIKNGLLNYQGHAEQFDVNRQGRELRMENLTMTTQADISLATLFDQAFHSGKGTLNLSRITYRDSEHAEPARIQDLYVTSESKVSDENDVFDVAVVYGAKNISMQGFEGKDFALGLEINNISQEFFTAYQAFAPTLVNADADQSRLAMDFLNANLLSLVQAEPEINITSLRGTLPQGSFESHFSSRLLGITSMPKKLDNTAFWLSHALLDAQVKGDKPVIELAAKQFMMFQLRSNPQTQGMSELQLAKIAESQVPMLLSTVAQQGLIVSDETRYTSHISLQDKVFKVNDNIVPFAFDSSVN